MGKELARWLGPISDELVSWLVHVDGWRLHARQSSFSERGIRTPRADVAVPVIFTIDRERRLLIARASGVLVDDDLRESRRILLDHPDFDREFNELFDAREVEEVAFSGEAMARMAQTSVLARESRRAFVASTPYQYRMACLFVTLAQPYQPSVQVFRDIDEALAWLAP